jgi:hypothetical protein
MGCINSNENFDHWFGNIHLSGPCNRSCYFCIGQHMQALDPFNNLSGLPTNIELFVEKCLVHGVSEVNLTGSNTDPLLHKDLQQVSTFLRNSIPNLKLGLRTNGVLALSKPEDYKLFDKVSLSVTSFDEELYLKTMGQGSPPNVRKILELKDIPVKLNVVLCPETVESDDFINTLDIASTLGISKVNLREPYGQPRIGDPLRCMGSPHKYVYGMPCYLYRGVEVTYWDVHYVEVESVNLYANGNISVTYPVTKGHHETGQVIPQTEWITSGRQFEQWKS